MGRHKWDISTEPKYRKCVEGYGFLSFAKMPHELLLTTTQKTRLRNAFENNMSTDIKLLKAQLSWGFLGLLLSKIAGPLIKVAVPLAKNILAPLGITAAASAIDAGILKKIHVSGTTTWVISNKEMNDKMKIVPAI